MDICTIIAKNYVAQARVLARSFLDHHPQGRVWTLVIDDFTDYLDPSREPFEILTPSEIGCDAFQDMAIRYSVLELSTAVKPWLLRHLMGEISGPVTYLDPDIRVFGSLDRMDELARAHGVVLTPHNTEPIPPDGRRPSQIDIMIAGIYNLGYLSVAPNQEVDRLLDWWSDRLRRDCRVDPTYGYFVDQRWFDLIPGFLSDYAIVREPQYNVAYWNLHSRELVYDERGYTVNGEPLSFFHFSGFDPDEPGILSRHQNRVDVAHSSALQRILDEYALATKTEGYAQTQNWPYTFDTLPNGTRLDPVVRKLYIDANDRGELSLSLYTPEGTQAFLEWLGEPAPGAPPGVHRLLAHLYGTRGDLRQAFPDLDGPDLGRLLHWARNDGLEEVPALGRLALGGNAEEEGTGTLPPPAAELWGVNVVGYFRSELGVGEAARQVVSGLDAQGVPVLPVHGGTLPLSRQGHVFTQFDYRDVHFPINLICVNADMLPDFAGRAGPRFFAGRYSIGLWFWEVTRFRDEWQSSFELVDEVWAPTAHVAEALAPISQVPVVTVRLPVEVPAIVPTSRVDLGVPDGFFFLFSFDYLSVFERKNPLAVVAAFKRAFAVGEGPSLVLKCINAEHDEYNHARLLAACDRPDIHVIDGYMSPAVKDALTATCGCYVSLHRAEGFGLTMAEAMYLGKPVIATDYSGNLDFMTPDNSLLVDSRLVPIGPGRAPYPADGQWAEPEIEHASALMRIVFKDSDLASALGARASEDIRLTHSPEAAGAIMNRRLESLRLHIIPRRASATANGSASLVKSALLPRVQRGPVSGQTTKLGPVGRSARTGVLRLMRPFTAHQEAVNAEVVGSLHAMDAAVLTLLRANAATLAQLRSHDGLRILPAVLEAQARTITEVKEEVEETLRLDGGMQTDRGLYVALAALSERHRAISRAPRNDLTAGPLTQFELRAFSQNGEDGVLAEILARIGAAERFFIEFGVESGREGNCVYLADVASWSGLFLEGDTQFFAALERKYRGDRRVTTTRAEVTRENVQELFSAAGVPAEPDVLSIDVDGADYWIWDAIGDYRPRVVVIEYNSALDPSRCLVQPADLREGWDGTSYYGASLGAMRALGERKGYSLVHTELSAVNAFFVRGDLAEGRFPSAEDVPVRGAPNFFQRGYNHPHDLDGRRYLDLESGLMVAVESDLAN